MRCRAGAIHPMEVFDYAFKNGLDPILGGNVLFLDHPKRYLRQGGDCEESSRAKGVAGIGQKQTI